MPRYAGAYGSGSTYSSSGGRGSGGLRAEEAAGIAILAIVVAILFMVGCWYFRRRNGYSLLQSHTFGPIQSLFRGHREERVPLDSKSALPEYSCLDPAPLIPGAPPAYEKVSSEASLPPPYTPMP
ncbi:melanoma antigen recognized by T-cells 1 [Lissotriton helveticus]